MLLYFLGFSLFHLTFTPYIHGVVSMSIRRRIDVEMTSFVYSARITGQQGIAGGIEL